jgi:hypothetical protein
LVREAGGTVAALSDGNLMDSGDIIATNQALYQPLRELLTAAIAAAT